MNYNPVYSINIVDIKNTECESYINEFKANIHPQHAQLTNKMR